MARKRTYKAQEINAHTRARLEPLIEGVERLVVGLDIAKKTQFACFMNPRHEVLAIVKFDSPTQNADFVRLLTEIECRIEIALESTGTYGEALRYALDAANLPVFQVAAKRVHDAAELYDGVPSTHDSKASAVIAWTHLQGYSSPWPPADEDTRRMRAVAQRARRADKNFQRAVSQIEAMLAVAWPELPLSLELTSATLLRLLSHFGSPQAVAAAPEAAAEMMRKTGRSFLKDAKIELVLSGAVSTVGVPMVPEEVDSLRELATEAERLRQKRRQARRDLEALSTQLEVASSLSPAVGVYTALMLVLMVGDPRKFASAAAYLKAFGLNLAESSSGQKQGRLHISRRGSSYARNLLFLAALRLIKRDALTRAWYEKRLRTNGGVKIKATVAVMRKLARALWRMACSGDPFDSRRLFESSGLEASAARRAVTDADTRQEAAMN